MKSLSLHSKEVLAKEKVVASIARNTTDELHDLADKKGSTISGHLENARDMTAEFLAHKEPTEPPRPRCRFRVYRGIIRKLEGFVCPGQHEDARLALLAGTSEAVLEAIIIHSGVSEALQHPELSERWKRSGYHPLGLAAWDFNNFADPDFFRKHLMELASARQELLLLLFAPTGQWKAWEFV